jgi:hypothetical protein
LNAKAHVSAWKHHSVFGGSEADDALTLCLICDIGCGIVYAIDVIHLKDSIVILKRIVEAHKRDLPRIFVLGICTLGSLEILRQTDRMRSACIFLHGLGSLVDKLLLWLLQSDNSHLLELSNLLYDIWLNQSDKP